MDLKETFLSDVTLKDITAHHFHVLTSWSFLKHPLIRGLEWLSLETSAVDNLAPPTWGGKLRCSHLMTGNSWIWYGPETGMHILEGILSCAWLNCSHESIWIPRIMSSVTRRTSLATFVMHAVTSDPALFCRYGTSCIFSTITPCTPHLLYTSASLQALETISSTDRRLCGAPYTVSIYGFKLAWFHTIFTRLYLEEHPRVSFLSQRSTT